MKSKLIINIVLIIFPVLNIITKSFAQTTPVQIIDPFVLPVFETDTITGLPILDSLKQYMQVGFKIDQPQMASKAWFYIGSAPDSGDVMKKSADFIKINNDYFLSLDSVNTEIKNYKAEVMITIMNYQYSDFKCATIFVEDTNGVNTDRLYYHFDH